MLGVVALAGRLVAWVSLDAGEDRGTFYGIVATCVVLYALGAGATVFAVEREEETDAFLQALPVRSGQLFIAKVALAVGSTLALAMVLLLLTLAWTWLVSARRSLATASSHEILATLGVSSAVAATALVWALFFSLVLRRPLVAACLAAVGALVAMSAVGAGTAVVGRFSGWSGPAIDSAGSGAVLALTAFVFALDVWLGHRWLRNLNLAAWVQWRRRRHAAAPQATTLLPAQRTFDNRGVRPAAVAGVLACGPDDVDLRRHRHARGPVGQHDQRRGEKSLWICLRKRYC